ncbi:hypothetical protein GCK72_004053 [Caenorhabditis remanei]|uniref:Uncharacterized protein n=1 Tax=Caenorhabditis remanei TaxID=31234 RepID=A0A6A5HAC1_CAERE|nr:hypothetical protein GCK72_004053 [Caenorhabditis remanei]KAF1764107.1 hypothetical protein GCK72_004053 [Caenorhabditis remanei]
MAFGPPRAKRTVAAHFWTRYGLTTHNAVDRMVYVAAQPGNFYPAEHIQTLTRHTTQANYHHSDNDNATITTTPQSQL